MDRLYLAKELKKPEGQMARRLERLQEFDFVIVHRHGRKHTNADSLSHPPCPQCGRENHGEQVIIAATSLMEPEDIKQLQTDDPTIGPVLKSKLKDAKPLDSDFKSYDMFYQIWDQLLVKERKLYRQYQKQEEGTGSVILQLVIPESKKVNVMSGMHGAALGGHLGEDKTLARIREGLYWPGYHNDKMCPDCAATETPAPKNKLQRVKVESPMQMWP